MITRRKRDYLKCQSKFNVLSSNYYYFFYFSETRELYDNSNLNMPIYINRKMMFVVKNINKFINLLQKTFFVLFSM